MFFLFQYQDQLENLASHTFLVLNLGNNQLVDLPNPSPLQHENSQLRQQVKALEERVHGLEEQLVGQINSLTTSKNVAYHGPDTVDHFNDFTMAKLLEEFELLSPAIAEDSR